MANRGSVLLGARPVEWVVVAAQRVSRMDDDVGVVGGLVDDRIGECFFGAIMWYSTKRNIGALQNVTLVYPKTEQRLNHKRNGGPLDHGTMALAERTIQPS